MESIAVHLEFINNDTARIIDKVKNYFQKDVADFFVFTDDIISCDIPYAILSSFYMRFYKGCVVFTSIESLLQHKNNLCCSQIILVTNKTAILESKISRHSLTGCSVLAYDNIDNDTMELIEYHGIS